jgi:MoaA/NifB/PqqE/SkfB family radical SAM enzyme
MAKKQKIFSPNIEMIENSGFADFPHLSKHFQKKQAGEFFYKPVSLEIELTNKCNLRCKECAISEDIRKGEHGLNADILLNILEEASKLGMYAYSLTGGEPFLRFGDMLKIINTADKMDCYKIQTNGTCFVDGRKSVEILKKLKDAGFGEKNRYVKSSLRCSVGIQDRANDKILKRIQNLSKYYYEVFSYKKADLAFIITHDYLEDPVLIKNKYEKNIKNTNKNGYIHIRTLPIHSTYENKQDNDKLEEIGSLLKESKKWDCFDNSHADTPWPKLLIRANGDAYSCASFAHVFKLGNIKKNSLKDLIKQANSNKLFKLIYEKGLSGLLREAKKSDPLIGRKKIPMSTYSCYCQICKILKETIKNK